MHRAYALPGSHAHRCFCSGWLTLPSIPMTCMMLLMLLIILFFEHCINDVFIVAPAGVLVFALVFVMAGVCCDLCMWWFVCWLVFVVAGVCCGLRMLISLCVAVCVCGGRCLLQLAFVATGVCSQPPKSWVLVLVSDASRLLSSSFLPPSSLLPHPKSSSLLSPPVP